MRDMLGWFSCKLAENQGILQAQLEDEMADFDAEDFKRMEKEEERSREQKQKQKKEFATADSSFWRTLRTFIRIAWKPFYPGLNKVISLSCCLLLFFHNTSSLLQTSTMPIIY